MESQWKSASNEKTVSSEKYYKAGPLRMHKKRAFDFAALNSVSRSQPERDVGLKKNNK